MSSNSFVYSANGDYKSMKQKKSNRVIEHMAVSIGNKNSQKDTTIVKEATNIQEQLSKSAVIKGMTELLSSVVNEVSNENKAELNKLITLNTTLNFENISAEGDINFIGIDVTTKLDTNEVNDVTQKIQTKVQNDISKKLKEKIANVVDSMKKVQDSDLATANQATNLGETMSNIAGTVGDTVSNVLSASIGNSTRSEKTNITDTTLNKQLKLNEDFTLEKNDKISSEIKNALSSKNVAAAANKTNNNTNFNVKNASTKGSFNVKDLKVLTSIKQVLNQTFNQTVLQDISTQILNDYDRNVNNMIKNAEEQSKKTQTTSTSGDIYAAGVAGKQVLEGVATAAVGVGEGLSTAAEGVGTGVATAAVGVGEGISTAAKGMAVVWVAIAIVLIVGGLIFAYLQMQGKAPSIKFGKKR